MDDQTRKLITSAAKRIETACPDPEWWQKMAGKTVQKAPGAGWPLLSDAAGVNSCQIEEATARFAAKGIDTHYTKDGRAIFTSRAHRKAHCEAAGLFDKNGGSGDPQAYFA